jgi:phage/plasmid-associated DNA primase
MEFNDVIKFISECDCDFKLSEISNIATQKKKLLKDKSSFKDAIELLLTYESESDNFKQFFEEKIKVVEEHCELTLAEIYDSYQEWFKTNKSQGIKCPGRKDLKSNINKLYYGKQLVNNKNVWKNLAIIGPNE